MSRPLYYICKDVDIEMPNDEGGWKGINGFEADGDTLEELLETARYFACDQDGGEAGQYEIGQYTDYDSDVDMITEELNKQRKVLEASNDLLRALELVWPLIRDCKLVLDKPTIEDLPMFTGLMAKIQTALIKARGEK